MLRSKPFQMTVALHAAIGGLVGLALILGNGLSTRADYQTADDLPRGDLGLNFESGNPFYAIPMALLLLPHLRKLLAAGVIGGAIGWVVYMITFQTRITSIMVVCVPCFVIAGLLRDRRRRGRSNAILVAGLLVVGLSLVCLFAVYALKNEALSAGLEALGKRWQGDESITATIADDPRYDEAGIVMEKMSLLDWIVGRGIGATWSDARIYGGDVRTMVHLGYLHFAFVGGLGLWWLCCAAPLVSALRYWRIAHGIKYAAVAYVLIRAIELLGYGVPHFSAQWLIVCVCFGAVFDAGSRRVSMAGSSGSLSGTP
jgi:hypothetical protein